MNKLLKNLIISFISILFLLLEVSCYVGLGSSVDTEAPKVSILYPPANATIRKQFELSGKWSDDKKLSGISVSVVKLNSNSSSDDSKTTVFTTEANVSNLRLLKTWSVKLNDYDEEKYSAHNGWQFSDGTYEISVIAKDNAGHTSGEATRQVKIDNSAPVLLFETPATFGSTANPQAFGQIVQFTGTFDEACENKIAKMNICFYDKNGTKLHECNYSNITNMGQASPLIVARYFTQESGGREEYSELYEAYKKIMGESTIQAYENGESVEDVQLYFTVTAYDNAKIYDDSTNSSGSGDGNATVLYYRGTTDMKTLVSGDGDIKNFSLASFSEYINKTAETWNDYSNIIDNIACAAQSISTNDEIITNVENDDSTNGEAVYSTFKINPKNNPLYTIGGFDVVSAQQAALDSDTYSSDGFKRVYSGTPINVSMQVGADNKNLKTSSISIYRVDKTKITSLITDDILQEQPEKKIIITKVLNFCGLGTLM